MYLDQNSNDFQHSFQDYKGNFVLQGVEWCISGWVDFPISWKPLYQQYILWQKKFKSSIVPLIVDTKLIIYWRLTKILYILKLQITVRIDWVENKPNTLIAKSLTPNEGVVSWYIHLFIRLRFGAPGTKLVSVVECYFNKFSCIRGEVSFVIILMTETVQNL